MIKNFDTDTKLLISRAQDCAQRAIKTGSPCFMPFLSDAEQFFIEKNLSYPRDDETLVFFGGYDDSDYKCAGFFPFFLFYDDEYNPNKDFPISVIHAKGSGFRNLSHRDFLGSLMALGIKREVIGDIIVSDDCHSSYIFCLEKTADFLVTSFTAAANDKIVCTKCDTADVIIPPRKFSEISATVSSPRIDALICACLNVSRDSAEKMISSGFVSLNHAICSDKSKLCTEGALVSIRHHGRFLLHKIGDKNRRDRTRIVLHRFM